MPHFLKLTRPDSSTWKAGIDDEWTIVSIDISTTRETREYSSWTQGVSKLYYLMCGRMTRHFLWHCRYIKSMTDPGNYSVSKCTLTKVLEILSTTCGCVPYMNTMSPNDSSVCTPAHNYVCIRDANQDEVKVPTSAGNSKELVRRSLVYYCWKLHKYLI